MNIEKLKRFYRKIFRDVPKSKTSIQTNVERHGSIYGGWNIIPNSLSEESIVYSIGIGKDISFDHSIFHKYNCKVYAYDPTPEVVSWIKTQHLNEKFLFHPEALSNKGGVLKFYKPKISTNISYSTVNGTHTIDECIEVKCKTLNEIMKENSHEYIDVLKMDIEGEELGVIDYIIEHGIKINQLLIEFHHFFPEFSSRITEEYIQKLENNGFLLFSISDSFCEYSFLKA